MACSRSWAALLKQFSAISAANLQLGANWLNDHVNGIPVVQNIVKPIGDVVNGIGDLANGAGESVDDFGSAIEKLSHGDFKEVGKKLVDSVQDAAGSVYDAGKDAVKSVVDSTKTFSAGRKAFP